MLISIRQKISTAKVVQVYNSKLNTEMIDNLRQLKSPSIDYFVTKIRKKFRLSHKGICLSDG